MAIEDIDFDATMSASFDATEAGTDYVSPTSESEQAPEAAPVTASEEGAEETVVDQDYEQEAEPAMPASLSPPERWSDEDKAQFSALTPEAQELVLKREKDVEAYLTKKSQELSETSGKYKGLDEVLASRRASLVQNYGSEAAAINALFSYSDMADSDPVGFINMLAQAKGIDLTDLINTGSDEYTDPEISALKQKVQQMEAQSQQAMQLQQQHQHQELVAQVEAFEAAKSETGELLHPHFAAVRNQMSALITAGAAPDMEQAYKQAVWANPETRKSLAESDEGKRLAAAKAKAAAAEKAASTRPRSTNGQFVAGPGKTLDDTMSAVYDSLNNA